MITKNKVGGFLCVFCFWFFSMDDTEARYAANRALLERWWGLGLLEGVLLVAENLVFSFAVNVALRAFLPTNSELARLFVSLLLFLGWTALRAPSFPQHLSSSSSPRPLVLFAVLLTVAAFFSWPLLSAPVGGAGQVFRAVVDAPIREEVLFRLVLPACLLRRTAGHSLAASVSALCFSALHWPGSESPMTYRLLQMAFSLLSGFCLAMHAVRRASIVGVVAMHAANNALAMALPPAMFIEHLGSTSVVVPFAIVCVAHLQLLFFL